MFLPNGTEFQLALALGPISHLCIFIHGELNNYATHIAAFFFLVFLSTVVIFYLSEPCIIANIVKASMLISTYLLALGGSILIYRALFHRLRQFPGDIFDSLSKWGAVMKAQRNAQYFLELRDLHKKYGDYVRIGQFQHLCQNSPLLTQSSTRSLGALNQQRFSSPGTAFFAVYKRTLVRFGWYKC
jgi:hypothetical protein